MAKNVGESRIPVPRATRPSFFPKSRIFGPAAKIDQGQRRSLVVSNCLQFVNVDNTVETSSKAKCLSHATSTPVLKGSSDNTASPLWNSINDDEGQELVHYGDERSNFFSLLDDNQLSRIEDVSDSCLLDLTLQGVYNERDLGTGLCSETTSGGTSITTPHYLMLNTKQNSFEHDESLGILTPDQMTDFTVALECSRTPSCENLTGSAGSRLLQALGRGGRPGSASTRPIGDVEPTEEGSSERTPSPEELPLDPKPTGGLSATVGSCCTSTVVSASFITSVTSITSLEAGYQGDGENSRPASRGADPTPMLPPSNLPALLCRQDPMTDSDFFTESDADAHEEIVRGDRRAQVIDGTLFCAPGGRRCPSFTGEEMDSSGIYSDLDKRQDEQNAHDEEVPEESDDRTPDTMDTEVSQKSQPSSVKAEVIHAIMDHQQVSTNSSLVPGVSHSAVIPADKSLNEIERHNESPRSKVSSRSDSLPLKKYKMPKRNVVSKIKAMIESSPRDEGEKEARRSQRSPRKGGRWDAVMSKIEAGKNEQRTRLARKEVKSRVLQTLGQTNPASGSNLKKTGDANNNNNKDKRRLRGRQEMKSPAHETARSSVRSSMSDLSSAPSKDALKRSPTSTIPPRRLVTNGRSNQPGRLNSFEEKKNCLEVPTVNLEKSPSTTRKPTITKRSASTVVPAKQQQISSSLLKDRQEVKDNNNTGYLVTTNNNRVIPQPLLETRDQAAQTDATPDTELCVVNDVEQQQQQQQQLATTERVIQALSITVQYLAYELDGFATPKLRRDYEKMKTEWLAACTEVEELRNTRSSIEEKLNVEREDHRRSLDRLREDLEIRHAEQLATLETALQEERRKCEMRLQDSMNESAKEHRATIARLRAEHEEELARKDTESKRRSVVHDQGAALRAEVESLRSVLELRSQENAMLRSELDSIRREIEDKEALEQRVDTLEARCEDLKAQLQCKESYERQISHENEVLLESFHQVSKQNKRLSQRNEELQWRLRQKNEVVTVLANQLASPTQRLSRSLEPEHLNHSIVAEKNGLRSSSMVKFMVEKGDSVSWTLEIDDDTGKNTSTFGTEGLGTPPKMARPEAAKAAAKKVSRNGSLRLSSSRSAMDDIRTRSKSISVTDSTRVEDSAWTPGSNSTPLARRRPRSDPSSSSSSTVSSSASSTISSSANATHPVAAAVAAAAAAVEDCNDGSGSGQRPQEAGGEAMISEETSVSSSEDESSTSSDIPRLAMQFAWGKPIK